MWLHRRPAKDSAGDDALIEKLLATPTPFPEPDLWRSEARLLAEVRRCQQARAGARKERRGMPFVLTRKGFTLAAAGVLALGAASTAGASGGVSDAAGNVGDVLAALHVTDRTPDAADEHIDAIEQPDGQSGAQGDEANGNASEGAENADDGINNSNASDEGLDHAADNASEGAGNADGEHGPSALPTQANEHTEDGAESSNVEPGVSDNSSVPPDVELPDEATDPPGAEQQP